MSTSPAHDHLEKPAGYRSLLTIPGAPNFFVSAAIARLGVAMTGISLLLAVQGETGSFATAGLATGALAVGEAAGGPQLARLVDKFGQSHTVPVLAGLHATLIVALIGTLDRGSTAAVFLLAAAAGAVLPQPGALSASRWSHVVSDKRDLSAAFSLEALVNNVVFFAAAPIATLLGASISSWVPSAAACLLVLAGCGILSLQRRTQPPAVTSSDRVLGRPQGLWSRRFICALGVNLGLGFFFGANPILVTSFAGQNGLLSIAGLILAVSSAESFVSGALYGSVGGRFRPEKVQLAASALVVVAVVVPLLVPGLVAIIVMLAVAGAAIAPIIATSSQIIESASSRDRLTQAFTWVNTASAAGIAMGASIVGFAVEEGGFWTACFTLLVLTSLAVVAAGVGSIAGKPREALAGRGCGGGG